MSLTKLPDGTIGWAESELTTLGKKYGTDKATRHHFTDKVYNVLFGEKKDSPIHILEIGAGKVGGSHKMWKDWFTQGEVYCMDPFFLPDQEVTAEELANRGIHIIQGNQLSRADLHRAGKLPPEGYDFIIDDASHMPDAVQLSLGVLFPYLKSNGIYVVEDIDTAARRGHNQEAVDAVNTNLARLDTKGLMKEEHQLEFRPQDSLEYFDDTGSWKSKVLTDEECSYLEENIGLWGFSDAGHSGNSRKNALLAIRKKQGDTHG